MGLPPMPPSVPRSLLEPPLAGALLSMHRSAVNDCDSAHPSASRPSIESGLKAAVGDGVPAARPTTPSVVLHVAAPPHMLQVLGSVMSDKSLDKFRTEYEKLHQALKKVRMRVWVCGLARGQWGLVLPPDQTAP
jgi:hypothetical protein